MLVSELCKENLTDEIVDRVLFEGMTCFCTFLHLQNNSKVGVK